MRGWDGVVSGDGSRLMACCLVGLDGIAFWVGVLGVGSFLILGSVFTMVVFSTFELLGVGVALIVEAVGLALVSVCVAAFFDCGVFGCFAAGTLVEVLFWGVTLVVLVEAEVFSEWYECRGAEAHLAF